LTFTGLNGFISQLAQLFFVLISAFIVNTCLFNDIVKKFNLNTIFSRYVLLIGYVSFSRRALYWIGLFSFQFPLLTEVYEINNKFDLNILYVEKKIVGRNIAIFKGHGCRAVCHQI
jgi:hypothetical protein